MRWKLLSFLISLVGAAFIALYGINWLKNDIIPGGAIVSNATEKGKEYTLIGDIVHSEPSKDAKGFVFYTENRGAYVVNSGAYYGSRLSTKIFAAKEGYYCLETPKGIKCYTGTVFKITSK